MKKSVNQINSNLALSIILVAGIAIALSLVAGAATYFSGQLSSDSTATLSRETSLIIILTLSVVVLPFLLASPIYSYLRAGRSKASELTTTLVTTLGIVLGVAVAQTMFGGISGTGFIMQFALVGLPIQFLICLAASHVASRLYERAHSMSIE